MSFISKRTIKFTLTINEAEEAVKEEIQKLLLNFNNTRMLNAIFEFELRTNCSYLVVKTTRQEAEKEKMNPYLILPTHDGFLQWKKDDIEELRLAMTQINGLLL
ncbi:hypothetical protein T4B_6403 [Trichinella pseudospiralis]|uniref:Uncharacterized protein n=1 Tax=Trichinella pseudospiralis TaxID=6337 RepID=A0A0V1K9B9_TRIPS|nr:hypothetical protein T4B_6403 [Trichinella pseudospiralis]KRZ43787.1 hypothetical protein T4C_7829 [Trichinella pseudospiralis]